MLVVDQLDLPPIAVAVKQSWKTWLAYAGAAALATLSLVVAFNKATHFHRQGEAGARVWFYDQTAHRLYPAPRDRIPPDGSGDSKVRAVVIGFPGMENDMRQLKIAYLEKYAPDLKALLERAEAAHTARKPFTEKIPSNASDEFKNNAFVKAPDEVDWHKLGTAEAREVMSAWRDWRGPAGQMPFVSVPSME
jgi:hypothetical protein